MYVVAAWLVIALGLLSTPKLQDPRLPKLSELNREREARRLITVLTRKQSADFFFFSPKNCGLHSSADYIRVRISFFFFQTRKNCYNFDVV